MCLKFLVCELFFWGEKFYTHFPSMMDAFTIIAVSSASWIHILTFALLTTFLSSFKLFSYICVGLHLICHWRSTTPFFRFLLDLQHYYHRKSSWWLKPKHLPQESSLQIVEEQSFYGNSRVRFFKTKLFLCVPVFTHCDHPMFRGTRVVTNPVKTTKKSVENEKKND